MRHSILRAIGFLVSVFIVHAATVSRTTDYISTEYKWEVDTKATLSKRPFKITPEKLIARAKEIINNRERELSFVPDDLADDFVFQFPIIGPLSKKQYLASLSSLQLVKAFPDYQVICYNFHIDPFQPNRVWYTSFIKGTHTGDTSIFGKPTGKYVETPPQSHSFIFNENGKIVKYTGGYVMDKELGNTSGLGGLFGPKYAIGRPFPFPEGKPWKPSLAIRFLRFIQKLSAKK